MKENWKTIEECPRYEVSDQGEVRNRETKRALTAQLIDRPRCKSKPLRVYLWDPKNKRNIGRYVHCLVATAFVPNPDGLPNVEHINGDFTDNRAENLRWSKHSDIMQNPAIARRLKENPPYSRSKK